MAVAFAEVTAGVRFTRGARIGTTRLRLIITDKDADSQ